MNVPARANLIRIAAAVAVIVAAIAFAWTKRSTLANPVTWQHQVSPGNLSVGHAFLENNCAACHTAVKGVEVGKCVVCHANNESLLQRQPTTFHASIGRCRECHAEHQSATVRPSQMDHTALAKIGLRRLDGSTEASGARDKLRAWLKDGNSDSASDSSRLSGHESLLNCATCHANQDRHVKLFGQDCSACHATEKWTIAEFRHPSPRSTHCAQCHQAPPSHYMEHFHMVSVVVAGKPHANVVQCFLCHQTTSWNDIKGVGWYKHH